ncbi:MAG: NAD(P)H-hydrate dehydratase [Spongiibacteraceae bacterium]
MTMPPALPEFLYDTAGVRALDRYAIDRCGIPGAQLMLRAGRAAFAQLLQRWPEPAHIHVLCGTGNNGGDGFVMAALAQQRGLPVSVWQVGAAARIQGDALLAREFAVREGVSILSFAEEAFAEAASSAGVVVDALLGTGLSGEVRAEFVAAIDAINGCGLPVLAADIPSGLCSDSGRVLGCAVRADLTVSFIGLKQGLFTGAGPECCGDVVYTDLGVPDEVFARVAPTSRLLQLESLQGLLPPRARAAHKGHFGHMLVVGGDSGMAGAALMASVAAGRVGAGLVSCATRAEHVAALVTRAPEVMALGVRSGSELQPALARASVVVIGPGLGQAAWGEQLLAAVLRSDKPLVIDADALNLLARRSAVRANWILTPHPGEAARLLGVNNADVQADRFAAARALQQKFGGAVVLKGAGTLVATAAGVGIAPYGNPGMASGGMGDVLSGVLGALLAQGLTVDQAAAFGVCLHGRAGDLAALDGGERGLLATDLLPHLRRLVNAC